MPCSRTNSLPTCDWDDCNRFASAPLRTSCIIHTAIAQGINRELKSLSSEEVTKRRARALATAHKRRGKLKQQPCADCGWHKSEMHHPDYNQPLLIVWLCRQCHTHRHRPLRPVTT